MLKKDMFKFHIQREHPELMLSMFIKDNEIEDNQSQISNSGFQSRRDNNQFFRREIPPGWEKFYLDPPIQLVGIPI